MADVHHLNTNDSTNNQGPDKAPDASAKLFEASVVSRPGDQVGKAGDANVVQVASTTDARGYDTAMLNGTSEAFQSQYFGQASAGENLAALTPSMTAKWETIGSATNPDRDAHAAAIQETVAYFSKQTPGLADVIKI